jgi:RNA polymerase sigma factor (sigma-70 family)
MQGDRSGLRSLREQDGLRRGEQPEQTTDSTTREPHRKDRHDSPGRRTSCSQLPAPVGPGGTLPQQPDEPGLPLAHYRAQGPGTGVAGARWEVVVDVDVSDLVRAAGTGDQGAWNSLVERYSGLVWNVARGHRLGDADASDVAQTVWLRLVESLPQLREPAAVGGWLATTARNESLRLLRRSGREVVEADLGLDGTPADDAYSPEAVLEARERRDLVRHALDRLSLRCQTLLRALAYSSDNSYADISAALDMPVGSIGPTRGRCLDRLRQGLRADAPNLLGE